MDRIPSKHPYRFIATRSAALQPQSLSGAMSLPMKIVPLYNHAVEGLAAARMNGWGTRHLSFFVVETILCPSFHANREYRSAARSMLARCHSGCPHPCFFYYYTDAKYGWVIYREASYKRNDYRFPVIFRGPCPKSEDFNIWTYSMEKVPITKKNQYPTCVYIYMQLFAIFRGKCKRYSVSIRLNSRLNAIINFLSKVTIVHGWRRDNFDLSCRDLIR